MLTFTPAIFDACIAPAILDRVEIQVMDELDRLTSGQRTIPSYLQEAAIYVRRGDRGMARLAIGSAVKMANRNRAPKAVKSALFRALNKTRV